MLGATIQNIVFYAGAFAISLELFIALSTLCSRGNENQTLAKIIYSLFGAGIAWIIDYSIHYSAPVVARLEMQFVPSSAMTFLAIFLFAIALWYGCLIFIEKVILPKRQNNIEALLAGVLAAFLAIVVRITYLTPVIDDELESEGIFLMGFIVAAGIFFASLLYYANRLLLTPEFEPVIPEQIVP